METDADQLSSLLSLVLLIVVIIIVALLLLPRLGYFTNKEPESVDDDDAHDDHSIQPLRKIFLEYRHTSVSDWINWVKNQDISRKNTAFTNLVYYLDSEPEEIGSLINEVIKAVVAFSYPESFTSINRLVESVRKHWGHYHTADQFYPQAVQGLVKLNEERAQSILITEFELLKNKPKPQVFLIAILDALSELHLNDELDIFWLKVLTDPLCDLPIKEHVIDLLSEQDIESRITVISQFFKFWNKSGMKKIPDNDIKIIQKVFYANQDLIVDENYELWDLVLDNCEKKLTEQVFVELTATLLENTQIKEELLLQLFDVGNLIRNEFLEALAHKHTLSNEELEIIKEQYTVNIKKSANIIDIKKYKKNKKVPAQLEDTYQHLVRALSLDQEFKNNNLPAFNLILGQSLNDKQYIIECLAANYSNKLFSVNLPELLGSVTELTTFKPLVNQNRPCIIYFYGLSELLSKELNDIEIANLELLNNLFKEFKASTGINFLMSLEISHEKLATNDEFKELFKHMFKLKYGLIRDIDKPDILTRQKLFNDCVKQVLPSRIKSSAGLELIAKHTEGYSLIEFLSYINSYMKFCLLVYGELKSPSELDIPGMDLSNEEEQEAEKEPVD